jgi:hypothetical protein
MQNKRTTGQKHKGCRRQRGKPGHPNKQFHNGISSLSSNNTTGNMRLLPDNIPTVQATGFFIYHGIDFFDMA